MHFALCISLLPLNLSCNGQPKRPEVVVYCSVDQAVAEPILAEFERASGIRVLARYDTEASKTVGLVQRLRAERFAPLADVFWSSEVFYTIRLADEGLLAPYDGAETADWPEPFFDAQRRWHGLAVRARAIVYNTERVKAADAPRRLEDLLDAKWKGRLVMARPQFGTTGGDVASWFVHYGPEQAARILRGLADNDIRLADGNSTVVRLVATGAADVGFTDTDDVYAGQRNGWPVAMHFLDQGGDGALAIPNTAALVAAGPNPDGARALMAFLLGGRAEAMLAASDSHNAPVDPKVAERFNEYALPHALKIDYRDVAAVLPDALSAAGVLSR